MTALPTENLQSSPSRRPASAVLFWCALAMGMLSVVLFPGIAQWLCDEPALIINALQANARGELATVGLTGTFQFAYGPFPTWFYQLSLLFSHNLYWLLEFHAVCFYSAVALSMVWLGYELKLNRWFVIAVVMSPAICFYSRQLWDNSFNIPLSILLLAAYARLLNKPSKLLAIIAGALMMLMLTIHMSAIPLIAAVGLHWIIFANWNIKKLSVFAAIGGVVIAGVFFRYFTSQIEVAKQWHPSSLNESVVTIPFTDTYERLLAWESPFFTLSGPRILGSDFSKMPVAESGGMHDLQLVLALGRFAMYLVFGLGFWFYIKNIKKTGLWKSSTTTHLMTVSVIGLVLQMSLFAVLRVLAADHYFNGIYAVYPLIVWIGLDQLGKSLATATVAIMCISSIGLTSLMIGYLWQNHGNQKSYGPIVTENLAIFAQVQQSGKSMIVTDVPHLNAFPQAMQCISELFNYEPVVNPEPLFVSWHDNQTGYLEIIPQSRMEKKLVAYNYDVSLNRSVNKQNK